MQKILYFPSDSLSTLNVWKFNPLHTAIVHHRCLQCSFYVSIYFETWSYSFLIFSSLTMRTQINFTDVSSSLSLTYQPGHFVCIDSYEKECCLNLFTCIVSSSRYSHATILLAALHTYFLTCKLNFLESTNRCLTVSCHVHEGFFNSPCMWWISTWANLICHDKIEQAQQLGNR